MDLSFTAEELAVRQAALDFAKRALDDDVIARDRAGTFSPELWARCAEFGIQRSVFPEEYGGDGIDAETLMLLMEGLGQGCRDSGLLFALNGQVLTVQMPILQFGTPEQRQRFLPPMCSGEWMGAHGMTEPGSGSDAFSLRTTARRDGDEYVLNGSKSFTTAAPMADVFLIYATVDRSRGFWGITAFLVERDTPGLRVGSKLDKMGLRTAPMAEVYLDDCRVPVANRLGNEGNGATIFNDAIEWERACTLSAVLGGMQRQLDTCVAYVREREQFGQPIGSFQAVAHRIADMKVRLETSRYLVYRAAASKRGPGRSAMDSAVAKLYVSEAWQASCRDAMSVHGGYGYATEFEVERDLRDAMATTIYSGTSDIQRNIIARHLGL